jgi:hypothetical protein
MQGRLARKLSVQPAQELEKLLVPVPFETLSHDAAFENVECGKQRGRAVPLVVVRKEIGVRSFNLTSRNFVARGGDEV